MIQYICHLKDGDHRDHKKEDVTAVLNMNANLTILGIQLKSHEEIAPSVKNIP